MMSHVNQLATFIAGLGNSLAAEEELKLVIAGDFVDFLAIEPFRSWTSGEAEACQKLTQTITGTFAPIFEALKTFVAGRHQLYVLLGNHDLELSLGRVKATFLSKLEAHDGSVIFVDDGSALRFGNSLIEHGNRYDGANLNDWTGLRAIRSALSRDESHSIELDISAGSCFVEKVINPLKHRREAPYEFVDLLEPQGVVTALLLLALEPSLILDFDLIARLFDAGRRQWLTRNGLQPTQTRNISRELFHQPDPNLLEQFGQAYEQLLSPTNNIATGNWTQLYKVVQPDSLAKLIRDGAEVPTNRLRKIQACLKYLLADRQTQQSAGDAGALGRAAERLLRSKDIDLVVMGHTHQARQLDFPGGRYINTGTWSDQIRVPDAVREEGGTTELARFLRELVLNKCPRVLNATAAFFDVEQNGSVRNARLSQITC
jgi:UDP-2,3-diacylglucosamine pyrophosphatase LpxH